MPFDNLLKFIQKKWIKWILPIMLLIVLLIAIFILGQGNIPNTAPFVYKIF